MRWINDKVSIMFSIVYWSQSTIWSEGPCSLIFQFQQPIPFMELKTRRKTYLLSTNQCPIMQETRCTSWQVKNWLYFRAESKIHLQTKPNYPNSLTDIFFPGKSMIHLISKIIRSHIRAKPQTDMFPIKFPTSQIPDSVEHST